MTTNMPLHIELESDAFPCDQIEVSRLSGVERISQLFQFDLEIVVPTGDAPERQAMAGAIATLVFQRDGEEVRRIHGMISEVTEVMERDADTRAFRLRLVPRAHRLAMVETQEIYMDVTVPDLLRRLFELVDLGGDVDIQVLADARKHEFVVQYKETDLAFVCRVAENHGFPFYFTHEDGCDRVVFTDGERFQRLSSRPRIPLRTGGERLQMAFIAHQSAESESLFKHGFGQLVTFPDAYDNCYGVRPKWLARTAIAYAGRLGTLRALVLGGADVWKHKARALTHNQPSQAVLPAGPKGEA